MQSLPCLYHLNTIKLILVIIIKSYKGVISMKALTTPNDTHLEEIKLDIYDSEILYHGGNQYWFPKNFINLAVVALLLLLI